MELLDNMFLKNLTAFNFKSYSQVEVKFHSKLNCFVGDNGQGKTNLLDIIYYLSICKSAFNPIDTQNIKHSEDYFILQGQYERDENEENIFCAVKLNEGKVFKRNNKEYPRLADHVGLLPVVIISPADLSLIIEGSEERRKFINNVIAQFDRLYLEELIRYNRILAQRNKLLKDIADRGGFREDLFEVLDSQLVLMGKTLFNKRKDFVDQLIPIFQKYYTVISGSEEKVELIYQSNLQTEDFHVLLSNSFSKDCMLQFTSVGIHKDDLTLKLNGHSIKKEGSQGQQKTYLIALKLAQFEFMQNISKVKPILLLDDIFDKLDVGRVENFIKLVSDDGFGQIFITDTNKGRLNEILDKLHSGYKLFKVDSGLVEEIAGKD
jgi:DNA replication and repair protein RecF